MQRMGMIAFVWLAALNCGCTPAHVKEPPPGREIPIELPHLRIYPMTGYVDMDCKVVRRATADGQWLEVLVSTRRGPLHETLLATDARPAHVHQAMLLLGLEPGAPMQWQLGEDGVEILNQAHGPRIAVTAIYEHDGTTMEKPVNEWIFNQNTNKPLADNIWLFSGSKFDQHQGETIYLADLNGTVLSLVHFGDDLLTRATRMTNVSDEEAWVSVAEKVPAVGTQVMLRLRPIDSDDTPQEREHAQ